MWLLNWNLAPLCSVCPPHQRGISYDHRFEQTAIMLCSSVVLALLVQFLWLWGSPAEAVGPDPFLGQAASPVADSVTKIIIMFKTFYWAIWVNLNPNKTSTNFIKPLATIKSFLYFFVGETREMVRVVLGGRCQVWEGYAREFKLFWRSWKSDSCFGRSSPPTKYI